MEREMENMSKFNQGTTRAAQKPLAQKVGVTANYAGGTGYLTDARSELFRLAVVNFVGEDTFYEKADARDERFAQLISEAAVNDFDWLAKMLRWLRSDGNMRSASLVGAAWAVKARLEGGLYDGNAELIDSIMQRADEPGEFVAFWRSQFGRTLPKPVLKALKASLPRLVSEYSYLKYNSDARGYQFADLLEVVHPKPVDEVQEELFEYILTKRYDKDAEVSSQLKMVAARNVLTRMPVAERRALVKSGGAMERLKDAGMTWEALAGWIQGPMDASAWEAVAPSMGYMALLRNLRNFDEAEMSRAAKNRIAKRLADPNQVAKSRQLPFRFLSAYIAAPSDLWRQPLNDALELALANVPELKGRTLVLVDTSGSMTTTPISQYSSVTAAHVATLFGVVMAARNAGSVDLYGFAGGGWNSSDVVFGHKVRKGASPLAEVGRFINRFGEVGHSTMMTTAIRQTFDKHDRIVVITDGQCFLEGGRRFSDWSADPFDVPESTMVYGINAVGNEATVIDPSLRNRHEFAGLTDAVFRQMRVIEAGRDGRWPWEI